MDTIVPILLIAILLAALLGLFASLGVDSRDGFADDRSRQAFR
jgi:hypothetical protein